MGITLKSTNYPRSTILFLRGLSQQEEIKRQHMDFQLFMASI